LHQVRLHESVIERVGRPSVVNEPFVSPRRSDIASADRYFDEPAYGVEAVCGKDSRLHDQSLQESAEGSRDLTTGKANKGICTQDRRNLSTGHGGLFDQGHADGPFIFVMARSGNARASWLRDVRPKSPVNDLPQKSPSANCGSKF
jgi:hypothetical protein